MKATNPATEDEQPAHLDLLDWLRARAPQLVVLSIAAAIVAMVAGFDISISRFWYIAGVTALLVTPLGWMTGSKVVSWLYNPSFVWLIDLDARVLEGGIYRLPPDDFREMDVLDDDEFVNSTYDLTQLSPNLYVGKQVDLEDMTVVGTWRGTLDDRELTRALRAVHECRGQLQDDAQRGFILESSAFVVVRRATRNTVERIVELFEDGSLPDSGEGIERAVDQELKDFGLDDASDSDLSDLVDDNAIDEMDHKSGFDFSTPEEPDTDRNGHAESAEVRADG
ncbi:hypothetical protein EXE48_08750 [Halorubrum sp. ASP1]|uniref:hypothetical protein n=1 Tax=Halorubrum sp. ASP1 TaxID=2518114 RepID=UPI0010F8D09E|nr:hypothetical protein [Halorubrum sp. ASP1]TKX61125.1 hypothetical protein EXE48_08750 [Halorubrum sp. ASP1]